jgi:hypothetical protein
MSGRPDTSATRRGPVRLGAPPPGEPQVAATGASGTASVSAQPVNDESLSTGKPVDVKPAADASGKPATPDKQASSAATKGSDSTDPTAPKKKSLFKKIIKPF